MSIFNKLCCAILCFSLAPNKNTTVWHFRLNRWLFLSIILFKESSYVNLYSLIFSILAYQKLKNCWRSKKWSNKPFILILSFSLNWVRYSHTNIYNKPEENSMNKPRIGFIHEHSLHKIFFLNTYTLYSIVESSAAPNSGTGSGSSSWCKSKI